MIKEMQYIKFFILAKELYYVNAELTSLEMVAVSNPRKYPNNEQWKYEIRYQLFGRGIPASAIF